MPDEDVTAETANIGTSDHEQHRLVEMLLRRATAKRLSLRDIATSTGLSRSHVGLLLHRSPEKRTDMSLRDLNLILRCLDLDLLRVCVELNLGEHAWKASEPLHRTSLSMLCRLFEELPRILLEALDEVDGADGSEIRAEWATPLSRGVVNRLIHEVTAVVRRRDALFDLTMAR